MEEVPTLVKLVLLDCRRGDLRAVVAELNLAPVKAFLDLSTGLIDGCSLIWALFRSVRDKEEALLVKPCSYD